MGVAQQNRVKQLNRLQIDQQLASTPRSKHDLIEERKDHAEKQAVLHGRIAQLEDEAKELSLRIESLEADVIAANLRGDSWKARCRAAVKLSEQMRKNWFRASELLKLAGTETVARLREIRDIHTKQE